MLWLKNARVIDPAQGVAGIMDLAARDGRVLSVGRDIAAGLPDGETAEVIDCAGKYLFPGLVDVHVHLREPGQEEKEDITSGSRAAVRGGVTSLLCMANTEPVIDNQALTALVADRGRRAALARIYPLAAVTKGMAGAELTEMAELKASGAKGFSDDGRGVQNGEIMRLALEYAKLTGCPIVSHCEDAALAGGGVMRRGRASAARGLIGIPGAAESVMAARDVLLAGETGGRLHLAHVSTQGTLAALRAGKAAGWDITAEVNPHHLILTDEDVPLTNSNFKVNPPLPTAEDRDALLAALADGLIDMLASDHAPHTWEEKARPFAEAPFGMTALETALAAVWTYLVRPGKLTAARLIDAYSRRPAERFGLEAGTLKPGAPADMILFDPDWEETVSADNMASKSANTPFLGRRLRGYPIKTWVGGRLVFDRLAQPPV
ncbi:MAG: dihydroorotase [Gracilibacteraceae bacterium]|jgi:dihydroorotase|nr:dihydroorotase [Gracilibacteraceae bacterium]